MWPRLNTFLELISKVRRPIRSLLLPNPPLSKQPILLLLPPCIHRPHNPPPTKRKAQTSQTPRMTKRILRRRLTLIDLS